MEKLWCPKCGHDGLRKHSMYMGPWAVVAEQRWECKACGHRTINPLRERPGTNTAVEKWLIIADTHVEPPGFKNYLCEEAFDAMMEYAKWYKPDGVVHLGDVGEFGSVSPWARDKPKLLEGRRLQDDIDVASSLLAHIKGSLPSANKFVVTLGNHEERFRWYFDLHPEVDNARGLNIIKAYEDAGWDVVPPDKLYQIGKLYLFHGVYYNKYHARKNVDEYGRSVMTAHTHTEQTHLAVYYDEPRKGISIPCLCNRNPNWLRNRPNSWVHGFATVDVLPNGNYFDDVITIIDGNFSRNGVVYG